MIKNISDKILNIIKLNYFWVCAALALLVPDLLLRKMVVLNIFENNLAQKSSLLFSLFWIALILFICIVFIPKKAGRIVFGIVTFLVNVLAFSSYIYYRIFEQLFWLSSIGLVGEAGNYFRYAISYLDGRLIAYTLISLMFLAASLFGWRRIKLKGFWLKTLVFIPVLGILGVHIYMQPSLFGETDQDWNSWSKPRIVYSQFTDVNKSYTVAGLYQFVARNLWKTWFPTNVYSEEDFKEVDKFFADKGPLKDNEFTGIFKDKNVIAVMMESMDDWLISDKYTPTISYMMRNGIKLKRHFAPTFGTGYTFNTEFAFNTGYYTPKSAVSAVNFSSHSYPYTLPKLFGQNGYRVNSFHYNNSEFYNRGIMHKSFGYEAYNSFMDFDMPAYAAQADSNILKNDAIYRKMTEGEKFFDFVVTYSAHIPYTYDDAKLSLAKKNHPELIDPEMDSETNNLLLLARDTDDFFRLLLERLEEDNLLENTVIIGFADHYAYGFSNFELLTKYSLEAGSGLFPLVPAFIYTPGIKHMEVEKVTQSADLLPTIANLMGLEKHNTYMGRDIFDDNNSGFVYFENGSWYDGNIYYSPGETEIPKGKEDFVAETNKKVKENIRINDIVISGDYFAERK